MSAASRTALVAATGWAVLVPVGCYTSHQDFADGGADELVTADASTCDGTWRDPTTGYLWENPPLETLRTWDDAVAYCNGLTLCDYRAGGWHLPTIDGLRSLIRGCPDTMPGGACRVTESCLDLSCFSERCGDCEYLRGPGPGGYYWDAALGDSPGSSWSSSSEAGDFPRAWFVLFNFGMVNGGDKALPGWVRCVHTGS